MLLAAPVSSCRKIPSPRSGLDLISVLFLKLGRLPFALIALAAKTDLL